MAGNCHCNSLRDTWVHEISDSRAPQVVNEKPSIFIPCEAVFISGLDQGARSKSTSCARLAKETSELLVPVVSEGRMYVWPEIPDDIVCDP
jgi:hypothetical protein